MQRGHLLFFHGMLSLTPRTASGGQPCKSLRTKDLVGKLVSEGFDPIEANSNGVVVEQLPAVRGDTDDEPTFQSSFEEKHKSDPDIALSRDGYKAKYASLSHGHLNVGLRNIIAGMRGCQCDDNSSAVAAGKCVCSAKPILSENGTYSLDRLKDHDEEWWQCAQYGIKFEVLSGSIDVEDADGAAVICIALNKKNETAMKTGHLEIMNTMESLCRPDPFDNLSVEPVHAKLIDMYGTCLLYTSPSPRDGLLSRMPSSA